MSIFGKKKNEPVYQEPVIEIEEPIVEPEPQPQEPEQPSVPKGLTVIGIGTVFVGDITTADRIEINGTVKGNVQSSSELNISGTGHLYGNAKIASLNVDGAVQGEITCSGNTRITDKGSVKGILASAYLNTAEGATIDGTVKLGAAAVSAKEPEGEALAEADVPAETETPAETPAAETTEETGSPEELPEGEPVSVDDLFA